MRTNKLSPKDKIKVTLDTLESKGFHIHSLNKYLVEDNIQKHQVIEAFFFVLQNKLRWNKDLLVVLLYKLMLHLTQMSLICLYQFLSKLPIPCLTFYWLIIFIFSKSAEAFKFVNTCCKELFFWDDCPRPAVMLGDFSLGLPATMVRKAGISVVEAGISQVYELVNYLDALKSDCTLQLCSWHAAKALKAWLIKEGYPKKIKKQKDIGLHSLI